MYKPSTTNYNPIIYSISFLHNLSVLLASKVKQTTVLFDWNPSQKLTTIPRSNKYNLLITANLGKKLGDGILEKM